VIRVGKYGSDKFVQVCQLVCVTNKTRACGKGLVSNKDVRIVGLGRSGSMKSTGQ
jgi:hypothetical protein